MRKSTSYNKLVGRIGDSYYFCDDIFEYPDGLKGATATVLSPVDKERYEWQTSPDGLYEVIGDQWREAVNAGQTEMAKDAWCEFVYDTDGDEAIYDFSGHNLWDQLREIGIDEENYPVIECVGGGRAFSSKQEFDEVYDSELLTKIREIEN